MTTRNQKNIRFKQAQQRAIGQQQATDELIKLSNLADKVAAIEIINSTKDMPIPDFSIAVGWEPYYNVNLSSAHINKTGSSRCILIETPK